MTDPVSPAPSSRIDTPHSHRAASKGRRTRRTALISAGVSVALIGGAAFANADSLLPGQNAPAVASPQRIGTTPHAPAGAVRTGTPAGGTKLQLVIGLAPRDEEALKSFIAATTTVGGPQYHHYLSKGQFAAAFGPTQASIAKVTAALKAKGLQPGKVSADGLSIPVTTTLDTAGHAFGTGFSSYRLADGSTGYLNSDAPQVDGDVSGIVSSVSGLNSLARRQTMNTGLKAKNTATSRRTTTTGTSGSGTTTRRTATSTVAPELCGSGASALASNYSLGSTPVSEGHGYVSAGNLARAYGLDHQATSGAGVNIGIFEMENFSDSDLAAYQACYGTSVSVTRRTVAGGPHEPLYPVLVPPNNDPSPNGIESLLDIEDVASLAPGANITVYQGPDLDKATNAQWLATYQAMVTDDKASILSISYGGCELDSDFNVIKSENTYSMEAAAQGQTILASSGDDGAAGCARDTLSTNKGKYSVSDPASQPYVTGVGGTSLAGSPVSSRKAWTGSGGGVSNVWAMNTAGGYNYQAGFTGSGFNAKACGSPVPLGHTCRQVPDVAANADPQSGYPVYVGGDWHLIGGTSGATPTWAALLAVTSTQPACKAKGPFGAINRALYGAARTSYSNYTDITSGTNKAYGFGYTATGGYDLPTGLGEPKAATLGATLCAVPASGTSTYHPIAPTRLLDTRGTTGRNPALPNGGWTSLRVAGNAGIPSHGVTAVVLNATVTSTNHAGYLTAWPEGKVRPSTSNIDWAAGQTIANLVTVPVGEDGWVDFAVSSSSAHVIADVQGYYTNDSSGQTLTPIPTPVRALDTRHVGRAAPSNTTLVLPMAGHNGVPSGAKAVVLNMTTVGTGPSGYLAAYPGGGATPRTSNIDWTSANTTLAGLTVVPIGANGNVNILVSGSSNVVADVFGYYTADAVGSSFHATSPFRELDTRYAVGTPTRTPVAAKHFVRLQVTGSNIPAGAKAVVLNLTVANDPVRGYATAWAGGTTMPKTSNLNWNANQVLANQVVVPVGADGSVDIYVDSSTHVIADVFGYFK